MFKNIPLFSFNFNPNIFKILLVTLILASYQACDRMESPSSIEESTNASSPALGNFNPMFHRNWAPLPLGRTTTHYTKNLNFVEMDPMGSGRQVLRSEILQGGATGPFNVGFQHTISKFDPRFTQLGDGDEVWLKAEVYFPQGFDISSVATGSAAHRKFFRIDTPIATNSTAKIDFLLPAYNNGSTYSISVESQPTRYYRFQGPRIDSLYGSWHTFEINIKLSSKANGHFRVFLDNNLLYEESTFQTFDHPGETLGNSLYFITYWNGGSTKTQSLYWGDVTFASNVSGRPINRDNSNTYDIIGDWRGSEVW